MKRILPSVLLAAAAVLLASCGKPTKDIHKTAAVPEVQVIFPKEITLAPERSFASFLEPSHSVEIRSRVDGPITVVRVKEGSRVEAGDTLFEIDARGFKAEVDIRKAELKEAESNLEQARSRAERGRQLFKVRAFSSEEKELRDAELNKALARYELAKAPLIKAELNLEYATVKAPISGVVGKVLVKSGNLMKANDSVFTTIRNNDELLANFRINEKDYLRLTGEGERALAQKETLSNLRFCLGEAEYSGKLEFQDNSFDADTMTFLLSVRIQNPSNVLLPNLWGRIVFNEGPANHYVVIPEESVVVDMSDRYVWKVADGKAVRIKPEIAFCKDRRCYSTQGITPEEQIIAKGIQKIRSGMTVSPKKEEWE